MKGFLVFLLAIAATSLVAQSIEKTPEKEVLRVENQRIQAVLRRDTAALEQLLADELVYTHSTGRVDSKAQFIHSIESGDLNYLAMKHSNFDARVYGDVAVLTGRSAVKVKSPHTGNQTADLDLRFLNVYAKRRGQWQQVAWQSTRIAPL
jgi:hypothetical protein